MHFSGLYQLALGATFVSTVFAHGAIVAATGDAGGSGTAIGIDESTPRDGTGRTPFQQDTTIFNGNTGCGRTLAGGPNDIQAGVQEVASKNGGLPQVTPGGSLQMTLHQVNADGAGPYRCTIDMTGTGNNFQAVEVTQNVRGFAGLSLGNGATPQPLTVQMPANMQCTGQMGGMSGVCIVRCQNQALAGPFGGCVPVQQAGAGGAAANNAAAGGSTAPAPATPAPAAPATPNAAGNGGAGNGGGFLGRLRGGAAGAGAGAGGAAGGAAGGRLGGLLGGLLGNRKVRREAQFDDNLRHSREELEGLDAAELEAAEERLEELGELEKAGKLGRRAVKFRA